MRTMMSTTIYSEDIPVLIVRLEQHRDGGYNITVSDWTTGKLFQSDWCYDTEDVIDEYVGVVAVCSKHYESTTVPLF